MKSAPSRARNSRLGCSSFGHPGAVPADLGDEVDDDRADQERAGVEVQRQVDRLRLEELQMPGQHVGDQREDGEQPGAEHRCHAVGRDQAELVGRFDLVAAHQVGHRRVLRRHPEQADALDQEAHHEQPDQRAALVDPQVRERDRQEEHEADEVGDHHRLAPVEPVGEHPGQRAEQDRRQQLDDEHAAQRVVLRLVAVRQAGGERGGGEQPEPVTEAGQRGRVPEPAERGHAQHTADRGDRGHGRRRRRHGRLADRYPLDGRADWPHGTAPLLTVTRCFWPRAAAIAVRRQARRAARGRACRAGRVRCARVARTQHRPVAVRTW